jgi:hypothetical protein
MNKYFCPFRGLVARGETRNDARREICKKANGGDGCGRINICEALVECADEE